MTRPVLAALLVALAVLLWPRRPGQRLALAESTPQGPGSPGARGRQQDAVLTSDDVATTMVLLSLALRSGCGIVEAVDEVASVAPPAAGRDLRSAAAAMRWGADDVAAWHGAGPAWSATSAALRLASAAGVAPSQMLLTGAADLRARELARVDVASARLGVRLVLPLGLTFLPAFGLTTVIPLVLALAQSVLSS